MNKRITSLLLCFVMIFSLLFTALPVFAVPGKTTTLTVRPDKATASPGETVTYTVTLGAVEDLLGIKFKLIIPEGLTFVTGAAKEGVKEALGATSAEFTPSTKVFLADPQYTGTSDLDLMTFECTVDSGAGGNLTVQLYIDDPDNYYDSDDDNIDVQVTNATITVTPAPKPATSVSLNKSTLELTVGESETLVATVTPADTTDTVTWDTGRSDVATVDNTGKVTAVAPGTAVIAARAGEKAAFCTVTVVAAPCTHTNKTNVGEKPSTCKEQGWDAYSKCNDCGQLFDKDGNKISAIPYLSLADHKYTANEKKPEALKTAGTCKDRAIYLRSCEVCGKVAPSEAWGSFFGDLDPNNHVGGTSTVNATEPDHKNQIDGYTGDTKCLGCGEIIATGTDIPVGAHVPSSTWNSDGTYHWKNCTTAGCGAVIDGSKAPHSSTGANVATCRQKAKCDVCGVEYGEKAEHNISSEWSSNETFHWHACQNPGCNYKKNYLSHTAAQTASSEYLKSAATCTSKAVYYEHCSVCNRKLSATFESGQPNGHTEGTEWKHDASNHWHACTVAGCGVVIETSKAAHSSTGANVATCRHKAVCDVCNAEYGALAAHNPASGWTSDASGHWHACQTAGCTEQVDYTRHTPDREAATETDPIKCSVCDYVITPELGHIHRLTSVAANPASCTEDGNIAYYKCEGCGKLFKDATSLVEATADDIVVEAAGHDYKWIVDKEATATEKGSKHEECTVCHDKKAAVDIPATGTQEDSSDNKSPQTGGNSSKSIWMALLLVSGLGIFGSAVYSKRKRSVR